MRKLQQLFKVVVGARDDNKRGTLAQQIVGSLPPGMHLPEPLKALFSWIEEKDLFVDQRDGRRVGFLFPWNNMQAGSSGSERSGGTEIEFCADDNETLKYWFGHSRSEVLNRLCVFARTGDDGSMAAFWLDPQGIQRIVHLGSGTGSTMVCVLADDAVDFLRLLAIGYDEICWGEYFSRPPNARIGAGAIGVHPNEAFQEWVRTTFNVTIPRTGLEVVKCVAEIDDAKSQDPFHRWLSEQES